MLVSAFLFAVASPAAQPGAAAQSARAQATAAVQIISGARIAASERQDQGLPELVDGSVRLADGRSAPARLVEFR